MIWIKAVLAYFKVLFRHLHGRTEKRYEKTSDNIAYFRTKI